MDLVTKHNNMLATLHLSRSKASKWRLSAWLLVWLAVVCACSSVCLDVFFVLLC